MKRTFNQQVSIDLDLMIVQHSLPKSECEQRIQGV